MEELLLVKSELGKAVNVIESGKKKTDEVVAELKAKVANLEKEVTEDRKRSKEAMAVMSEVTVEKELTPEASRTSSTSLPPVSQPWQKTGPSPRTQRGAEKSRKRSSFMKKPRILYIGDSVAHNAEFNNIEMVNRCRMRTMKAYSSVNDGRARWVKKNFADVAPLALKKTHEDDPYSHLVLSAPTVDITNIDTSKLTENDNMEV